MCKARESDNAVDEKISTHEHVQQYTFKEISAADVDDRESRKVVKEHEANGAVVLGAFVAGSLVGIIIGAPTILVLVLAGGVAAVTKADGKVGHAARKVGKVASNVLITMVNKGRQMNQKYHITDKAKGAAHGAVAKVKAFDEKRGFTRAIKTKANSVWQEINATTVSRQMTYQGQFVEAVVVTDGTAVPLDVSTNDTLNAKGGTNSV